MEIPVHLFMKGPTREILMPNPLVRMREVCYRKTFMSHRHATAKLLHLLGVVSLFQDFDLF
jgi:hypothetical protein